MQNGGSRDGGAGFALFSVEGGGGEHADAHDSCGVGDFEADFGGAKVGIEDGENVVHAGFEGFAGKSGEVNVGGIADAHGVQVIFIDVADDPDVGQVGDGERIGAAEAESGNARVGRGLL